MISAVQRVITNLCLRIVCYINRAKNNELAYTFHALGKDYAEQEKKRDEYTFWDQN